MSKSDVCLQIIDLQRRGKHTSAKEKLKSSNEILSELERSEIIGNISFYNRDFQEAANIYTGVIEKSPEYLIAPYQYLAGCQLFEKDELVDAFKRFQNAIEIDPSFVDAYVELGALLMKVQDYKGAVQCYTDAIKVDSKDLANYHNLVVAFEQLDKSEPEIHLEGLSSALAALESAKKKLPETEEKLYREL